MDNDNHKTVELNTILPTCQPQHDKYHTVDVLAIDDPEL